MHRTGAEAYEVSGQRHEATQLSVVLDTHFLHRRSRAHATSSIKKIYIYSRVPEKVKNIDYFFFSSV